jgi:hypothetical protein
VTSSSYASARRKTKYIHGKSILFNPLFFVNTKLKANPWFYDKNVLFTFWKIFLLFAFFKFLLFFISLKKYAFFPFVLFILFCQRSSSDPKPSQSESERDIEQKSKPAKRHRGPDKKPRKSGSDHGNYKHGLGKTRGVDTPMYAAWKEGVMQQNDFCCFITGEKKKDLLTCHHLNSWDSYPDQRYDISNGVTITKEIHRAFHKEYGAGKNTKEQFERFLQEKYNIYEYPWQNDDHEPTLSVDEIALRRASMHDKYKQDILSLIEKRGHTLISANEGFYTR